MASSSAASKSGCEDNTRAVTKLKTSASATTTPAVGTTHSATPSQALQFDAGPSLVDLFHSAKKLLHLQSRVENRQLRKANSRTQLNHLAYMKSSNSQEFVVSPAVHHRRIPDQNDKTALDLLSPLSIDELQNNTIKIKPEQANGANQNNTSNNTNNNSNTNKTLLSSSSSLSSSSCQKSSASPSHPIKDEIKVLTPGSDISSTSRHGSNASASSTNSSLPSESETIKAPKSNLTSSLSKLKNQDQSQHPQQSQSQSQQQAAEGIVTTCFNCKTQKTPLWRKDASGNTLCNACGLFLKLHGTTRPLSLKTDVIKKRNSRKTPSMVTGNMSMVDSMQSSTSVPRSVGANSFIKPDGAGQKRLHPAMGSSVPNGVSSHGTPISSSNSTQRFKNVLILPKPPSASNLKSSFNSKSIAIPSSLPHDPLSSETSPASASSSVASSSSYSYTVNNNQPFKRKKSEVNIAAAAAAAAAGMTPLSSSFSCSRSRDNSTVSLTGQSYQQQCQPPPSSSLKRTNSIISSTSLSRRTSLVNIPSRKSISVSTPINSLTSNNVNSWSQRNPQSNYFDVPQQHQQILQNQFHQGSFQAQHPSISRHNSATTFNSNNQNFMNHDFADTPCSYNSPSSFANTPHHHHHHHYQNHQNQNQNQPHHNQISQNHPHQQHHHHPHPHSQQRYQETTPSSVPETPLNVVDLLPSSTNSYNKTPAPPPASTLTSQLRQQHLQQQTGPKSLLKQRVLAEYQASRPPMQQRSGIDDELVMMQNDPFTSNSNNSALGGGGGGAQDNAMAMPISGFDSSNGVMNDDDFFKNYTSLNDDEVDIEEMINLNQFQQMQTPQESQPVPVTFGNDFMAKDVKLENGNANGVNAPAHKDLDWLKFEL
ncbi:uncharacterized protein LODBEIA_P54230 [Lodderomyces beijingensis]|uniref:GATA-type domain-containing protein n=1 Tax=Lodderomyces beijingensis TaxID=1775926 RepID=A0ABP0ZST9_9ASCO